MRIGVTTPTGNVGQHVVRALVRAGVRPVLLFRDPGKIPTEVADLVDLRVIDQFDVASTVDATRGVDALFWVDPTVGGKEPRDATSTTPTTLASWAFEVLRPLV